MAVPADTTRNDGAEATPSVAIVATTAADGDMTHALRACASVTNCNLYSWYHH